MPRRRTRRAFRILSWNVYIGQAPALVKTGLLILIALCWPHMIVLQEAKRFKGSIPGYRRQAADKLTKPADADNNVIYVRKSLRAKGHPIVTPGDGWVHKKRKPPRTFYASNVADPDLTVVDVHRCTRGYHDNRPEWDAEHRVLVEDANSTRGDWVALGDWNANPDDTQHNSPADLAEQTGSRLVYADEAHIDFALVRGKFKARGRRLPNPPTAPKHGPHRPFLLTLNI